MGRARVNRWDQIACHSSCFNVFLRAFEPLALRVCLGMLDADIATVFLWFFVGRSKAVPHAKARRRKGGVSLRLRDVSAECHNAI